MARGKNKSNKSKASSAKLSTRSTRKNGATKQRTLDFAANKGFSRNADAARNGSIISGDDLIDTDDDESETRLPEIEVDTDEPMDIMIDNDDDDARAIPDSSADNMSQYNASDSNTKTTTIEPDGSVAMDTELHLNEANYTPNNNGKRKQKQTSTPSSILRKSIRAKHKGSIVVNPYTPTMRTSFSDTVRPSATPARDCNTNWRSRFTVKLSIPESPNALEAFGKVLQGLMSELDSHCEAAEKVFILPWAESDLTKIDAIATPDEVPTSFTKLGKFMPRLFPGKGEEHICYIKLHIGHDRQLDELQADMKYWLMSNSHGMYFESLQCEDAVFIGWLLWSLKSMDIPALVDDIVQMTGIQVGLRWMAIDTGARGKVELKDKVFALHVEVTKKDKRKAKKAFLELYGKNTTDPAELPLYLRLRFIIPKSEATSSNTITKLKRFRERQKNFLLKICTSPSSSIVHLDWRKHENQQTLRELMMELKSRVYDDTPIFFSVDLDWTKTSHVVSYLPVMTEEATHTLHTLIPLLRYVITQQESSEHFEPLSVDDLHSFFTDEAVEDTEDMYYDEKQGRIIDPLSDANLEFVDNENLLGADDEFDEGGPVERPALQQLRTGTFPGNSGDSISTLGHSLATGILSPGQQEVQARARASRRARSGASVSSSSTGVTVEDFTNLKRDVGSMQSTLERLASLMEQQHTPSPNPSANNQVSFGNPSTGNSATGEGNL